MRPAPTAAGPRASAPVAPARSAADADAQPAKVLAPLSKAERHAAALLELKQARAAVALKRQRRAAKVDALALKRERRAARGGALVRGAVADTAAARVAPAQPAARGSDSAAPASAPAQKRKRGAEGDEAPAGPAKKRAVGGRE